MVFQLMRQLLIRLVLYQTMFLDGKIQCVLFVRTKMKKLVLKFRLINFHVAPPVIVLRMIRMKKITNHVEDSYRE